MDFGDKADLIQGLRKAMGDDRPLFAGETLDGKYIDERIAFEYYSPEKQEELRRKYAKTDEEIEKQKKKIQDDMRNKAKLEEAFKDRQNRKIEKRSGEQFYIKQPK